MGLYSEFLVDWFATFPQKQIHIMKMEEYSSNRMKSLEKVFEFLELGKYGFKTIVSQSHKLLIIALF